MCWQPGHWSAIAKPCRHCGALTNLRDELDRPAHKVCAEEVAERCGKCGTGTELTNGDGSPCCSDCGGAR